MGKKKDIIVKLLGSLIESGSKTLEFDNKMVKAVTGGTFANQFDATKFDNTDKLPQALKNRDYFVIHLGSGKHRFVKGIKLGYHSFEKIPLRNTIDWKYRKSILNETDTSEASILSLIHNQRIAYDFLYEDIVASPKVYNARRTKTSFKYKLGNLTIKTEKLQIEMDMVFENEGIVTIAEAKNGFPSDFALYQLYNPFRYYWNLDKKEKLGIKEVHGLYVLKSIEQGNIVVRLYLYGFKVLQSPSSIHLLKVREYRLIKR